VPSLSEDPPSTRLLSTVANIFSVGYKYCGKKQSFSVPPLRRMSVINPETIFLALMWNKTPIDTTKP
jgi:hypothetical protein